MKRLVKMPAMLLSLLALLSLASGCRLARYELKEPLNGRAVEVKSGDRLSVVLEEDCLNGYRWMPSCEDPDVSFARETIKPDEDGVASIGATGKVRIIIRVHRGFDGPSHVILAYVDLDDDDEPVRQIDLLLHKKAEDTVPWK